jgi:hypothetical protein
MDAVALLNALMSLYAYQTGMGVGRRTFGLVVGSLFFLVKEPVAATLLLAVSLIAGELGGRAASRWVATKERKG